MVHSNPVDILLVEDNPNDAELALRALKKNNLANNLCLVTDGEQALDFMFARGRYEGREIAITPRIILLDLKLPKVDGLEVLKAVKADERTRLTPIVVLTTSKEERDILESYRLGVYSYIVKPVDFDKFVSAVRDLGMYWLLLNEMPHGRDGQSEL
ncbi:MAG: response regulator [Spirochaetaceae bacterium]|nr:response regulator [Spirochaetaceae bacterium]